MAAVRSAGFGRAGIAVTTPSRGPAWVALAAVLAAYLVSFAVFYPNVITITDEAAYLRQAAALADGHTVVLAPNAFTGRAEPIQVSNYPPGTSLLMAPFIALGGWKAAFLLGALCLAATVLLLAWWLEREGRSRLFAIAVLMYPPALVISRCAMSDLPSTLIVTAALVLFWESRGRIGWTVGAGFLAGLSFALRDTNPLIFVPFAIGALVRRERGAWPMAVAAAVGGSVRFLSSLLVYGEVYHRNPGIFGFALSAPLQTLPIHLLALLVLVPGGLVFAALYSGKRRPEVLAAIAIFVVVHLFYTYDAASSGGIKQLILAPRYFCPLLPLLIFAASDSITQLASRFAAMLPSPRVAFATIAVVASCEAVAANWAHARWSRGQRAIVEALYSRTTPQRPVITNLMVTRKYLNELYEREFGPRVIVDIDTVTAPRLATLLTNNPSMDVVLLDRRDSDYWRAASDADQHKIGEWATTFDVQPIASTGELSGVGAVRVYSVRPR